MHLIKNKSPVSRLAAALGAAIGCLVISNENVLVLANPAARRMLELARADIGRPFHELIISYRPLELRSRIEDVRARGRPLHISGVQYQRPDTEAIRFDVDVDRHGGRQ